MTHLRSNATSRTLTVVLPESDWQALRAVEPDAVGWLHERIRERLGSCGPGAAPGVSPSASVARGLEPGRILGMATGLAEGLRRSSGFDSAAFASAAPAFSLGTRSVNPPSPRARRLG